MKPAFWRRVIFQPRRRNKPRAPKWPAPGSHVRSEEALGLLPGPCDRLQVAGWLLQDEADPLRGGSPCLVVRDLTPEPGTAAPSLALTRLAGPLPP